MRIPKTLENALINERKKINAIAAQRYGISSTARMKTKAETLDIEIKFWEIEVDENLDDFIRFELSDALFSLRNHQHWNQLPIGYAPLFEIIDFERGYQSEGWEFVSNIGKDGFEQVIQAHRFFKLNSEVDALNAVLEEYIRLDDEASDFHDLLSKAYRSVENATPEFEDQLNAIRSFIRNNVELFSTSS